MYVREMLGYKSGTVTNIKAYFNRVKRMLGYIECLLHYFAAL